MEDDPSDDAARIREIVTSGTEAHYWQNIALMGLVVELSAAVLLLSPGLLTNGNQRAAATVVVMLAMAATVYTMRRSMRWVRPWKAAEKGMLRDRS